MRTAYTSLMILLAVFVDRRIRAPFTESSAPVPTLPCEVSESASGMITKAASTSGRASFAMGVSPCGPTRSLVHTVFTSSKESPASLRSFR